MGMRAGIQGSMAPAAIVKTKTNKKEEKQKRNGQMKRTQRKWEKKGRRKALGASEITKRN